MRAPFFLALDQSKRGFNEGICGTCAHTTGSVDGKLTQLFRIRLDEAYPVFSNGVNKPSVYLPDAPTGASYTFNQDILWSSAQMQVGGVVGQIDSLERFEIVVANKVKEEVVDMTIRRFQRFKVWPQAKYLARSTAVNNSNVVFQIDTLTADEGW